jgi:hypothetical protein
MTPWQDIESAPKDGQHILAMKSGTTFGYYGGKYAPPIQTVVHWWSNPGEEGFYTSVTEHEPQHPFEATHWKPLDGLVRDPGARCGRCGARHIEHDLEPVGFICPDREGVFFALPDAPVEGGNCPEIPDSSSRADLSAHPAIAAATVEPGQSDKELAQAMCEADGLDWSLQGDPQQSASGGDDRAAYLNYARIARRFFALSSESRS